MRTYVPLAAALFVASASVADAQSGWEARVTAVPNPMRAGSCATLRVEPVDDHGYRRSTLSNGETLDARKYAYELSNASHFVVRNDPDMRGYVCADSSAPTVSTTVTVTLPDGMKGTVELFVLAKGAPPAQAVVYRQQAPLRLPTSPEYAPGFVPGQTQDAAHSRLATASAAPGAQPEIATTHPLTTATAAPLTTGSPDHTVHVDVTSGPLAIVGPYHTVHVAVTSAPLTIAGPLPSPIVHSAPTSTDKQVVVPTQPPRP